MAKRALKRVATKFLLRRSGGPNVDLLRKSGAVQCAIGGTYCQTASAAVVAEVNSLMEEGLITTGIQVAAHCAGKPLVSVWGGLCASSLKSSNSEIIPIKEDSLIMAYSVAKGVASTALVSTAANADISLEKTVSSVWPAFAKETSTAAKKDMTIAEAAGYRGGMPEHPDLLKHLITGILHGWQRHWDDGISWIVNYEPEWEPGSRASYHPISYSWIVGGIVQQLDPKHRHIGDIVAEDIASKLGYGKEMYLGRLPSEVYDSSRLIRQRFVIPTIASEAGAEIAATQGAGAGANILSEDEVFDAAVDSTFMTTLANARFWSELCLPSSNGYFSARALSAMYGAWANGGRVTADAATAAGAATASATTTTTTPTTTTTDAQLLPESAVAEACARIANPALYSASLSRFATKGSSGYRDSLGFHPYAHEELELYGCVHAHASEGGEHKADVDDVAGQAVGCSGAGGSVAFADPVNGLGIAVLKADYTETRLGMAVAERLIRVIRNHAPRPAAVPCS